MKGSLSARQALWGKEHFLHLMTQNFPQLLIFFNFYIFCHGQQVFSVLLAVHAGIQICQDLQIKPLAENNVKVKKLM